MSATKWKSRGFVRPWSPRSWPISHIGECLAGDDPVIVDRTAEREGQAFVFVGVPPGLAEQPLMSVYDRVAVAA